MIHYPTQSVQLSTGEHTYCDVGTADCTLLLLHGFSFRPGLYPLAEHLRSHFRVLIPDLPFTTNEYAFREHTLEHYVDFLLEFVAALKLERVSIFGNSLGGTLALMCDLAAPRYFENLIVRSPLWSAAQFPWYLRVKPLVSAHMFLSRNQFYAVHVLELFYKISARVSPSKDGELQKLIPYDVREISPSVLSKFLGELIQIDLEASLQDVCSRTLILWGKRDTFIPSSWGIYLESLLPNAQFSEMVGEYHNIATVDPVELGRKIISFVK